MTANQLSLLLSVAVRGDLSHGLVPVGAPNHNECKNHLVNFKFIEPVVVVGRPFNEEPDYKLTEKGQVFFEALTLVPDPIETWVMPTSRGG